MIKAVSSTGHISITVVIPVYQQWHLMEGIFNCLRSQDMSEDDWEVLIVDNGSDQVPEQGTLPSFARVLHCQDPGSYAARNTAISEARGKLLVFTDADCRPDRGWLAAHWLAYQRNGDNQLNAGGIVVKKLTAHDAPNPYEMFDILLGIPQKRYAQKRGFGVTANLAVPAALFRKIGTFDARRFSGGDAEFCWRAQEQGARLGYVGDAQVVHPPRATWDELASKARRVKGAQVMYGSLRWRLINIVRTFLPPQRALRVILGSDYHCQQKWHLTAIAFKLRGVEAKEMLRLLLGKSPERV